MHLSYCHSGSACSRVTISLSLQGFFKRSVQNNKYYTCAEQRSCLINLSQRKRCPFCRFQKCLAVGMKREGTANHPLDLHAGHLWRVLFFWHACILLPQTTHIRSHKRCGTVMPWIINDNNLFHHLSTAVRADRMRGGRNKFGPLYRWDRQIKQQKVHHQPNPASYRMKMGTTQTERPTPPNDLPLMSNHTSAVLSSDALHESNTYPSGMGTSGAPMTLDCTMNADRVFSPLSLPYSGLYQRTFPGYLQEKVEMPYSYSQAPTNYVHPILDSFTTRSTPASSPCSKPSSSTPLPHTHAQTLDTTSLAILKPNLLNQLLVGEQDESQLCAKVLASLQREQANRGKHDRLNTFSIMCKIADQTLFGLVEWSRNSALFKELKVRNHTL